MFELMSSLFIFLGAFFMAVAALGVWRLPELCLKMHAATKAGTLGCGLILLGCGIKLDSIHALTEVIILIIFIMITNPISAHLIGKINHLQEKLR